MTSRNRAEGWQHAKFSGHENERLVAQLTETDVVIQQRLLSCAHLNNVTVEYVGYGGLNETDVDSVFGSKTKSKTDMWLLLSNGKRLNVSIKKDAGGQVFLISIDRFVDGFELQYKKTIPDFVKRALSLYFGSAEDTMDIVEMCGGSNRDLEMRKHRLVAETLEAYDKGLSTGLIQWFNDNISDLFDFCFAKGLASNPEDWAQIVWYINLVGENHFNEMFYLPDLQSRIRCSAIYGTKNGGSTIQLPFGFVQWHSPRKKIPGEIQFHHSLSRIESL